MDQFLYGPALAKIQTIWKQTFKMAALVWFSNGIWKLDDWASEQLSTIQNPDWSGILSSTVICQIYKIV